MYRSLATTFGVYLAAGLWLASCGGDAVVASDEPPKPQHSTTTEESSDWQLLKVDPEVENYQPAQLDSALPDPTDDSVILIRFFLNAVPCEGAQPVVVESAESVTVSIEIGNHKNFAAMSCLAEQRGYEMTAQLSTPLGDRELLTS